MFVETGQQIYQGLIRQSSEAGLEVNSINKERKRVRMEGQKDHLCREEKELYKSYLIRNSDGASPMRKIFIVI